MRVWPRAKRPVFIGEAVDSVCRFQLKNSSRVDLDDVAVAEPIGAEVFALTPSLPITINVKPQTDRLEDSMLALVVDKLAV